MERTNYALTIDLDWLFTIYVISAGLFIMYTTNIIEGVNRQFRKVTKAKSSFPSDNSLEKMLYLVSQNVKKKWTQRYRNWDLVLSQLMLLYPERLNEYL